MPRAVFSKTVPGHFIYPVLPVLAAFISAGIAEKAIVFPKVNQKYYGLILIYQYSIFGTCC